MGKLTSLLQANKRGGLDDTMSGRARERTGMERMPKPEQPGKKTQRKGKHNPHRIRGRVKEVTTRAVHGGHVLSVRYHPRKGKKDKHGYAPSPYIEPSEHFHANRASLQDHYDDAVDNMDPEQPDSSDLASGLGD